MILFTWSPFPSVKQEGSAITARLGFREAASVKCLRKCLAYSKCSINGCGSYSALHTLRVSMWDSQSALSLSHSLGASQRQTCYSAQMETMCALINSMLCGSQKPRLMEQRRFPSDFLPLLQSLCFSCSATGKPPPALRRRN